MCCVCANTKVTDAAGVLVQKPKGATHLSQLRHWLLRLQRLLLPCGGAPHPPPRSPPPLVQHSRSSTLLGKSSWVTCVCLASCLSVQSWGDVGLEKHSLNLSHLRPVCSLCMKHRVVWNRRATQREGGKLSLGSSCAHASLSSHRGRTN